MSPKESWLAIARLGPAHMDHRHHSGANLRDIDATESEYRGVPISHNTPIVSAGRLTDFGGRTVFGFTLN